LATAGSALLALLAFLAQLALAFADFFWLLTQEKSFQIQRAGSIW
jgi:hypothetical protein